MDELDLVRLARPAAAEPVASALERMKADALGAPEAPAGDAAPVVELVELVDVDEAAPTPSPPAPHRRRLVLSAVAAAVVMIAGILALSLRHTTSDRRASGPPPTAGGDLRTQIAGVWYRAVADGIVTVSFQAEDGGAVTVGGPCGTYVSRGYRLDGDRLVLAEPLTSVEGCVSPAGMSAQFALLSAGPALRVDSDTLHVDTETFSRTAPAVPSRSDVTAAPPTLPVSAPHTPTLDELHGRTFLATGSNAQVLTEGQWTVSSGCNATFVALHIVDGHVAFDGVSSYLNGCTDPDESQPLVGLLRRNPIVTLAGPLLTLSADGEQPIELTEVVRPTPSTTVEPSSQPTDPSDPIAAPPPGMPGSSTSIAATLPPHTPTMAELVGRTFVFDGASAQSTVTWVDDHTITGNLGCNGFSATAAITDDRLAVTALRQTLARCVPAIQAQETTFSAQLNGRPTIELVGTELRLDGANDATTLTELRTSALVGTVWRTSGHITGGADGAGQQATLTLRGDGTYRYEGCFGQDGHYAVNDRIIHFSSDRRAQLQACPAGSTSEEDAVLRLLTGDVTYGIDRQSLKLVGSDGGVEVFDGR